MCRRALDDGCRGLVATPHQRLGIWWNDDDALLRDLLRRLEGRIGPAPRLHLGGEIRVDGELLDAVENLPASGLLPLAGSRYLLLELDRRGAGPAPEPLLHELLVTGWRPIVAHPEFAPQLTAAAGLPRRLVEMGARLQVTAASLIGGRGRGAQRRVLELLDDGLVHFVASDAHDLERRPPGLAEARRALEGRYGAAAAARLTSDNPQAVLDDRTLPADPAAGA